MHLYSGILHSREKEGIHNICHSLDGPGEYYAKWDKAVKEKQIPYDPTYMWNLMNKIN